MEIDQAIAILSNMFETGLSVASPILIVTLVSGVVISIFQVITQIQEMTLTFVPKIFISCVVLFFMGHWMLTSLVEFAQQMFALVATY